MAPVQLLKDVLVFEILLFMEKQQEHSDLPSGQL